MVLDNLGDSLRKTLAKVANATRIDADLVKEVVRDIQRALLQADVNVKLVLQITKRIEDRSLTEKPKPGAHPREHVVRIVYEELVAILGKPREVAVRSQRIMLLGLYGQGKTTTAGKLAKYFQKKGLRPALIAADVHRPAAYDQLKQLSEQVKCPFYGEPGVTDAPGIVKRGLAAIKGDVFIVDTAGRHSLDDELMKEIEAVARIVNPQEKLLVLDAQVGQQAGPQAKAFATSVAGLTGVIVTKLDGTAKAGGALSAVAETGAPIVFIGVGEHVDDFEKFDSARFISRLLGMGDIQTLLEKAQEVVEDEAEAERAAKKIMSGKFTLRDMRDQMDMLTQMGPLSKVMDMIPGISGAKAKMPAGHMDETQARLKRFRVVMDSMTEEELENPDEIKGTRIARIAKGAGVTPKEVKDLLKYYETSKRAVKSFAGNKKMQKKLMEQFGGMEEN
ncbi:MAG: signal recognition particle protein [Euryarchaeota archaeon]|nr:signal recognition particle protein [Euryarchaeota archaeon]